MVQVTTQHDKELNQKIFRIRGDEGYAKTTKTVIEARTSPVQTELENYNYKIKVTVYRSVGDSKLVILDNGESIGMFDWDSTSLSQNIDIEGLAYDVDHNLQVRFMGNLQCRASLSNTLNTKVKDTTKHSTEFEWNESIPKRSYYSGGNLGWTLWDIFTDPPVKATSMICNIYVDGEEVGTATTNNNGVGQFNLGNLNSGTGIDHGLRKIMLMFDGYENTSGTTRYLSSHYDLNYSVGLNIKFDTYPKPFINGVENTITATVSDWQGNPVNGATVYLDSNSSGVYSTTDNRGRCTITVPSSYEITNDSDHYLVANTSLSQVTRLYSTTVSEIRMSANYNIVHPQLSTNITIQLVGENIRDGIKVNLIGGGLDGTYTTDSNGKFVVEYKGKGSGDVSFTATCGNTTQTLTIEDVLFSYGNGVPNYIPFYNFISKIEPQTDALRFHIPDNGIFAVGLGSGNEEIGDYELTFMENYGQGHSYGLVWDVGCWRSDKSWYDDPLNYNTYWNTDQEGGTQFKIVKQNGKINLYQKHSSQSEWRHFPHEWDEPSADFPCIILWFSSQTYLYEWDYLDFTNIKLKQI